jgi:type II secretory ATPase GspE/PulE/Tfp pilus assembly ATPase PilB-like protein
MAQRLVRVLCSECKVADDNVDLNLLRALGLDDEQISKGRFMKAVGCDRCHGSGYYGRLGIFEIMLMNSEMREMAFQQRPLSELRKAARAFGMRTLVDDAVSKAMAGVTSIDEVMANASKEIAMALSGASA